MSGSDVIAVVGVIEEAEGTAEGDLRWFLRTDNGSVLAGLGAVLISYCGICITSVGMDHSCKSKKRKNVELSPYFIHLF